MSSDDEIIAAELKGKTLLVYMYLLRSNDPDVGVREVQRSLGFSSPSVSSYHLNKLRELGLVDRLGTLQDALDAAGRMSGLGDRPRIVRPARETFSLLDLLGGIDETRVAAWIQMVRTGAGVTPRLNYEWP